ncbi:ABC transporter substrate-binding protein [Aestuariispira insulae]|uniref:Polar amino acid transport system substrate-binding protein/arginine/ornithine transport system substrate-binding protein n=1 Tax=Aestuariispira insulae TaxID=1461337 RepID=A0A3D9HIA3_9PROT|nr:ABC transporter substrate-binding protein [Aestuariispira insulae]RED49183.1 polar amino acid transport system substrate-binding protein/arginine/ornithine transport system substrate-binding protein [Aestuariispira insulae]
MFKKITMAAAGLAMTFAASSAMADGHMLKIGVEGAYPPFSEKTADGTLVGFDVDIAMALCEKMGKKCELVEQDWDGIIPNLLNKKYDAIIASMSITEERKKKVDFSEKYYNTPSRFVAKEGVDWADTNEGLAGKTVGVQRGTIQHDYLLAVYPDADVKPYGTAEEAYLDIEAGRLDAILVDSLAVDGGFLKTDAGKGFAFFGGDHSDPKYFGDGAGVAVRKGEEELRDAFTKAIQEIRADGTYEKINMKYFDFDIYGG